MIIPSIFGRSPVALVATWAVLTLVVMHAMAPLLPIAVALFLLDMAWRRLYDLLDKET